MNDPCNPNANMNSLRVRLKSNFLVSKNTSSKYNQPEICKIYTYCKDASSLPPMKFVTTGTDAFLIDRFSPLTANDYTVLFGTSKLDDIRRIAKKIGIIELNSKKNILKGTIVDMLKKMGIAEPIKIPVSLKSRAKKNSITPLKNNKNLFGTPSNNNNKKNLFGTPSNNNNKKNLFGTPSNNNNNNKKNLFGTPSNNNNNNKKNLFGAPSNKNNKKNLFGAPSNKNKNNNNNNNNNNKNKKKGGFLSGLFGGRKNNNSKPPSTLTMGQPQGLTAPVTTSTQPQLFGSTEMKNNRSRGFMGASTVPGAPMTAGMINFGKPKVQGNISKLTGMASNINTQLGNKPKNKNRNF